MIDHYWNEMVTVALLGTDRRDPAPSTGVAPSSVAPGSRDVIAAT